MFSYRTRIIYLLLLIFFSLGVFFYLLDSWQIINLEEYIPGLSQTAPLVSEHLSKPSEIDWSRLEKEKKRLEEQELKIEEESKQLSMEKEKLAQREESLNKKLEGLNAEKELFEQNKKNISNQEQNIRDMANRMQSMPPKDAVEIVANWSNSDLVKVLLEMERNAKSSGKKSVVSYLLTLFPRERAALLMSLMLDARALNEVEKNEDNLEATPNASQENL